MKIVKAKNFNALLKLVLDEQMLDMLANIVICMLYVKAICAIILIYVGRAGGIGNFISHYVVKKHCDNTIYNYHGSFALSISSRSITADMHLFFALAMQWKCSEAFDW